MTNALLSAKILSAHHLHSPTLPHISNYIVFFGPGAGRFSWELPWLGFASTQEGGFLQHVVAGCCKKSAPAPSPSLLIVLEHPCQKRFPLPETLSPLPEAAKRALRLAERRLLRAGTADPGAMPLPAVPAVQGGRAEPGRPDFSTDLSGRPSKATPKPQEAKRQQS